MESCGQRLRFLNTVVVTLDAAGLFEPSLLFFAQPALQPHRLQKGGIPGERGGKAAVNVLKGDLTLTYLEASDILYTKEVLSTTLQ